MRNLRTFDYRGTPFESLRQIHLDFHTPGFVTVGDRFDAGRFFDTLEAARVNGVTVFALCHHGYSYFDTRLGVRHPGLSCDLLGRMADESARRGIQLLSYFSLNVNEVQAARHPEWHALFSGGASVNTQILQDGTELFWTWLCPNRAAWVDDFFLPHVREALDRYPMDGVFVDMACYLPHTCFCDACRRQMQAEGLNPDDPIEHARFNARTIQGLVGRLRAVMDGYRQGLRLEMGGYLAFGEAHKAAGQISEFYLESLAFQTGWEYLPMAARYYRNFGLPAVGMTGRFLKNWGDFGTVASPHQLKTQLAMHLAAGLPSSIGDHLHCNGELDTAVYEIIGDAFAFIEKRQPYCVGMNPGCEAAILVPSGKSTNAASKIAGEDGAAVEQAYTGACKLMTELHLQYDLITDDTSLDAFKLLIVAQGSFDRAFVARARTFVSQGGLLLVSGWGLLCGDDSARLEWQELIGLVSGRASEHQGLFYEPVAAPLLGAIPNMPHYVHAPAIEAAFADDVTVLARAWYSPNVRSRQMHYGHFHGPPTDASGTAIGVRRVGAGTVILIRPRLLDAYLNTGYFVHRNAVRVILDTCLPADRRLLTTNAPTLVEVAYGEKSGRLVLQLIPFVNDRRYRYSFESLNEPVEFRDVWVDLPSASGTVRVTDPVAQRDITFETRGAGIRVHVPPFSEHLLLLVEGNDSRQPGSPPATPCAPPARC